MRGSTSIAEQFRAKFGANPRVYRAPGRVNLIGEHTDYNEGYVMPVALGFYCWLAISPRDDQKLVISSDGFSDTAEVELDSPEIHPRKTWSDYPVGVALELKRAGVPLRGANLLIHGEVPMGAGLSSSAAIEVATALALAEQSGHSPDRVQLALLCQKAENEFVGARCGIMDQFISLHGRKNHALLLDCRALDFELVAIPECVRLVICNTMVKHEHASSGYNQRRAECEEAVQRLAKVLPGIRSLRDVTLDQLDLHRGTLSEVLYKRALHVIAENARVLGATEALRAEDLERFGKRMAESHSSLRDLYEVSCVELDLMVDQANRQEGVYGARMTGGGFGGSTINLVESRFADAFAENMARGYEKETGIVPQIYICAPAEGAGAIRSSSVGEKSG
ncbi:MAG: galactokinase [Acidobacteria bacterium]|jgi:galactokinase|nr:MAG: galactokinase [Acidobacteriota bacterium]